MRNLPVMKKVNIHGELVEKKVRIKVYQTQLVNSYFSTGHSSPFAETI